MLWTLIVLLLVFWVLGLAFKVAAGLIHVLLVIAVVLFLVNLISGRKARSRPSRHDRLIAAMVYLVPVGAGRFELYSEAPDDDVPAGAPPPTDGFWKRTMHRMQVRWDEAVRAARGTDESAGWVLRVCATRPCAGPPRRSPNSARCGRSAISPRRRWCIRRTSADAPTAQVARSPADRRAQPSRALAGHRFGALRRVRRLHAGPGTERARLLFRVPPDRPLICLGVARGRRSSAPPEPPRRAGAGRARPARRPAASCARVARRRDCRDAEPAAARGIFRSDRRPRPLKPARSRMLYSAFPLKLRDIAERLQVLVSKVTARSTSSASPASSRRNPARSPSSPTPGTCRCSRRRARVGASSSASLKSGDPRAPCAVLHTDDPYSAFARAVSLFAPARGRRRASIASARLRRARPSAPTCRLGRS